MLVSRLDIADTNVSVSYVARLAPTFALAFSSIAACFTLYAAILVLITAPHLHLQTARIPPGLDPGFAASSKKGRRQAWQLKAFHLQHSSKLVCVLFAFRMQLCVCVCMRVCESVCEQGRERFADTNLPSTLYVLFVSHLLHAPHTPPYAQRPTSAPPQPSVAVTMPIMQYKLRLIVNAKLLSSRRQLVLAARNWQRVVCAMQHKTCQQAVEFNFEQSCHGTQGVTTSARVITLDFISIIRS